MGTTPQPRFRAFLATIAIASILGAPLAATELSARAATPPCAEPTVRLLDAAQAPVAWFCTAQAAIDAAGAGHTVLLGAAVYPELLSIPAARPGLTLCAADGAFTGCGGPDPAVVVASPGPSGVRVAAGNVTLRGFTLQVDGVPGSMTGVEGIGAVHRLTVVGLAIRANTTSIGEDGVSGRFIDSVIQGNSVSGWATAVRLRPYGSGNLVADNEIGEVNSGVVTWSAGTRVEGNTFRNVASQAVDIAFVPDRPVDALGTLVLRDNDFGGAPTAIRVRSDGEGAVAGARIDARLNLWGSDAADVISQQVEAGENEVLTIPFLTRSGEVEPGLPRAIPASLATSASCAAHPDAEWIAGACRFLTVQAALDFVAPGGTVYVPASATPAAVAYHEVLRISTPGVTLCGSIGGALCAADVVPGHWQTQFHARDSTSWALPPVVLSGYAVRIDLGTAPGHGSTSHFPPDGKQVGDLQRFAWDQFLASGMCTGGSPRIQVNVDVTGDDATDGAILVTAPSVASGCAVGTWQHIDLLSRSDVRWSSKAFGGPSTGSQSAAHQAVEAAAAANGVTHSVVSVNLVYDSGAGVMWFDNQIVDNAILGEPVDETCRATRDVGCREAFAVSRTVLDGSGSSDIVRIEAGDVTVRGLTVRHTGVPVAPVTAVHLVDVLRPVVSGNRILLMGGGCPAVEALGPCYQPFQVTGIAGRSMDAAIRDNEIAADLVAAGGDGTIGGTNGIIGRHERADIRGNELRAWRANAMFLTGADAVVESNFFRLNSAHVLLCEGADGTTVAKNLFSGSFEAVAICGADAPAGVALNDNQIDLSNGAGLVIRTGAGPVVVDATCNDWGVYSGTAIRQGRIRSDNRPDVNVIRTTPFTAPQDENGFGCLVAPVADFDATTFGPHRGETVRFADSSTAGSKPIVLHHWSLGDGARASGTSVSHAFAAPGVHNVTLRVRDLDGMVASVTKPVSVANGAPSVVVDAPAVVATLQRFQAVIRASDPEGDAIAFSAPGLPEGAVLADQGNGTALVDWPVPAYAGGERSWSVVATDAFGAATEAVVLFTVVDTLGPVDFLPLPDIVLSEGGRRVTGVRAVTADEGPLTLTASGLPSWAAFEDAGAGRGRFTWAPPVGSAGVPIEVTLHALAPLGSVTRSFRVSVGEHVVVSVRSDGNDFPQAAPGVPLTLTAFVKNEGRTPSDVALAVAVDKAWEVTVPSVVHVPGGAVVPVQFTVVPASGDALGRLRFDAHPVGHESGRQWYNWRIDVPVDVDVVFTEASAVGGVRGQVVARFLDGSPAVGRPVTLAQAPSASPDWITSRSGVTDGSGVFAFDFGTSASARSPGAHAYEAVVEHGGKAFRAKGAYHVAAG